MNYWTIINKQEKTLEVVEDKGCEAATLKEYVAKHYPNKQPNQVTSFIKLCFNSENNKVNYDNIYKYARNYKLVTVKDNLNNDGELDKKYIGEKNTVLIGRATGKVQKVTIMNNDTKEWDTYKEYKRVNEMTRYYSDLVKELKAKGYKVIAF